MKHNGSALVGIPDQLAGSGVAHGHRFVPAHRVMHGNSRHARHTGVKFHEVRFVGDANGIWLVGAGSGKHGA